MPWGPGMERLEKRVATVQRAIRLLGRTSRVTITPDQHQELRGKLVAQLDRALTPLVAEPITLTTEQETHDG